MLLASKEGKCGNCLFVQLKKKRLVYLLLVNELHIYFVTLNFFVSKRDKQTYLTTLLSFTQVIYVKVYINVDTAWLCFRSSVRLSCKRLHLPIA